VSAEFSILEFLELVARRRDAFLFLV